MRNLKKAAALLSSFALLVPTASNSINIDVEANALLMQALTVGTVTHIDFGNLEFDTSDPGGAVSLAAADGAIFEGTSGYQSQGTGVAGSFVISSTAGETLMLSCTSTATLVNSADGNKTLGLFSTNYDHNGNNAACTGVASAITSGGSDLIKVGGSLQLPAGNVATEGNYSTSLSLGVPVQFTIVYQ